MQIRNRKSGFTIIELLVASAVTAILAGLMLTITMNVTNAWTRSSGTLSANSQAQMVLDTLAQDLQGAVHRNDGNVWLAVNITDGPRMTPQRVYNELEVRNWVLTGPRSQQLKPTFSQNTRSFDLEDREFSNLRFGFSGAWLRFFTIPSDSANPQTQAAVSAVSYQIVRRNVTGSTPGPGNESEIRYMLYRSMVAPQNTFAAGYDFYPFRATRNDYYIPPASPLYDERYPPPGTVIRPDNTRIMANNVIDFGVRLYARQNNNLRLVFPANSAGFPSNDHRAYYAGHNASSPFPEVAEVFVRILTDEGAKQIQNLEAGLMQGDWWQIAEANSRVFTRKINLQNRSF